MNDHVDLACTCCAIVRGLPSRSRSRNLRAVLGGTSRASRAASSTHPTVRGIITSFASVFIQYNIKWHLYFCLASNCAKWCFFKPKIQASARWFFCRVGVAKPLTTNNDFCVRNIQLSWFQCRCYSWIMHLALTDALIRWHFEKTTRRNDISVKSLISCTLTCSCTFGKIHSTFNFQLCA